MTHLLLPSLVLSLLSFSPIYAQEKEIDALIIGNDMFTIGEELTVTETLPDDLFIAGLSVSIEGSVDGDIFAAGKNVIITGIAQDDVRAAGETIIISGTVQGDLLLAGETIRIAPSAVIQGSAVLLGTSVILDGTINGNVLMRADGVSVGGTVNGTMDMHAEKADIKGVLKNDASLSAKELQIQDDATITGNLRYWRKEGHMNVSGIVGGSSVLDPSLTQDDRASDAANVGSTIAFIVGIFSLYLLLSAAMVIALLQLATKKFFKDAAKNLQKNPWMSLLYGALYFVAMPGMIALLGITIVGLPLSIITLCIYLISLFVSSAISALLFAKLLEVRLKKTWHPVAIFFISLAFYIIIKLFWLIPVVGWLFWMIAICFAYGAIASTKWEIWKKVR